MPAIKTITQTYKEHKKVFLKHLRGAKSFDKERVHKLRVEIKRQRFLFKFLAVLSKNEFKKKKAAKLFSPLFKCAGEIRTTELNLQLSKNYRVKAMEIFAQSLETRKKQNEKNLFKQIKDFDKNKFEELSKDVVHFFEKENKNAIKRQGKNYVKKISSEIRLSLSGINDDEKLHEFRKKLKDLKTIASFLEDRPTENEQNQTLSAVKIFEEKIGEWHDRVVLTHELEQFLKNNKKNKNVSSLSATIVKIKSQNEANKKTIIKEVKILKF